MMRPTPHYLKSELIALLLTARSMKEIAEHLLLTEVQTYRAAKEVYKRAKVGGRIEFMAREIERLTEGRKAA